MGKHINKAINRVVIWTIETRYQWNKIYQNSKFKQTTHENKEFYLKKKKTKKKKFFQKWTGNMDRYLQINKGRDNMLIKPKQNIEISP